MSFHESVKTAGEEPDKGAANQRSASSSCSSDGDTVTEVI